MELPPPALEAPELETLVERHALTLSNRDAWTLRHVATAIATGVTLTDLAEGLLADLGDVLSPTLLAERKAIARPSGGASGELFAEWLDTPA